MKEIEQKSKKQRELLIRLKQSFFPFYTDFIIIVDCSRSEIMPKAK